MSSVELEVLLPQLAAVQVDGVEAGTGLLRITARVIPYAFRVPPTITTCQSRLQDLQKWLNWLTRRGIASLAQVTQEHCDAYYAWARQIRDKDGRVIRDAGPSARSDLIAAVQEPALYSSLFSTDRYPPTFTPWSGRTPHYSSCRS
ncbi:hypothetical protein [Kitasatospora sp. NPDC047058]|uniref:hypothetical protein n=1 Tax=Kitasatospora sp. NPDC047058 TaxID=3155620 RepID=UPI0034080ECF